MNLLRLPEAAKHCGLSVSSFKPADPIECVLLEVVLLERDGKRTVYRISRKVVIS